MERMVLCFFVPAVFCPCIFAFDQLFDQILGIYMDKIERQIDLISNRLSKIGNVIEMIKLELQL